ncbi:tryptophan 5-monooxygenase, partial [Haematococcus lacustris]
MARRHQIYPECGFRKDKVPQLQELSELLQRRTGWTIRPVIWHLTKVYWYTVEFGVVREGDSVKAFGAGILSSFGELQHLAAGRAQLLPFDPFAPQPKMSYKDGYQQAYFVL